MEQDYTLFTDNVKEPVNVIRWFILLFTWDGILPVTMAFTPSVVRLIWPGDMMARDFAVVLVVIAGLFVRVIVGLSHIRSNYCGPLTQKCQRLTLFVMAFFLVMMDCLLMTIPMTGRMHKYDLIFLLVFAVIYLSFMAFVLFPGRKPVAS